MRDVHGNHHPVQNPPRVVVGEAETFPPGEFDLLRSRGVEVVVLDDPPGVWT